LWGWHWGDTLGFTLFLDRIFHISLLVPSTLSLVGPIPTPSPQHSLRIFQKQPQKAFHPPKKHAKKE